MYNWIQGPSCWGGPLTAGFGYLTTASTGFTLPETNMALENNPLETEIPIGNHGF